MPQGPGTGEAAVEQHRRGQALQRRAGALQGRAQEAPCYLPIATLFHPAVCFLPPPRRKRRRLLVKRSNTVAEHICCLHIWKEVFFCACGVHSSRKTEPGVINPVPYVPFTPKRATVPVSPKLHPPRCRSLVVPVLPSTGAG